jgi:hypothetical protein
MADSTRLLVFAGAALADVEELPGGVRVLIDGADDVFVVTPTLTSRLQWLATDIDTARHEADERLNTVLGHLESTGVAARGAVGDDVLLTAMTEHIHGFQPHHLLIALRSGEQADWNERGLTDRVRETYGIPTTVFEIDAQGHVVAKDEDAGA